MESLAKKSVEELQALIRQYPFASIFHVLRAIKTTDSKQTKEDILRAAIRVPSRVALNYFIHPKEEKEPSLSLETLEIEEPLVVNKEQPFEPESAFIPNQESTDKEEHTEVRISQAINKIDELLTKKETKSTEEIDHELNQLYTQAAIEATFEKQALNQEQENTVESSEEKKADFITWVGKYSTSQQQPSGGTKTQLKQAQVTEKKNNNSVQEIAKKSATLNPIYYTETLGFIFEKQEKWQKAIEVYTQLMNNNPEKSSYFADKIQFIQKNHL